jgi:UDP-N-acetyl-2-amino-2-deoxyglucuronate dehydrogenase
VTPRGPWYDESWKGDVSKSGGVVTNIGVHFLDLLLWLFGRLHKSLVFQSEPRRASGFLALDRANVRWFLSVERKDVVHAGYEGSGTAIRDLRIEGAGVDLSGGFGELHTESYVRILGKQGFSIQDARPSIDLAYLIRESQVAPLAPELAHRFLLRDPP